MDVAVPDDRRPLRELPTIDVRDGGPVAHATACRDQARAVRDACLGWLPAGTTLAAAADPLVRGWMARARSPYVEDIAGVAEVLGVPGAWTLHAAYLFGCTALADEDADGPRLRRTLDWPFPGLGALAAIARQRGHAGEFFNVTWPGFVGVLTAMAPGRFAAAINQAPMRRLTVSKHLAWADYARNAAAAFLKSGRWLPEHLLRHVFETCVTFAEARTVLERTPLARPTLFTLTGTLSGERLVIEREETAFRTLVADRAVANAWRTPRPGWQSRVCGTGTPEANNATRIAELSIFANDTARAFAWACPPVVNVFTRLTVEMSAARGTLDAMGWEAGVGGEATPVSRGGVCPETSMAVAAE